MAERTLTEQEFNDLKAKVLDSAPQGLSEVDLGRFIGPAMAQAVGTAENSPEPVRGSAVARFAEGAWKNLNPAGLIDTVSHPMDAVKNLIEAHSAQLDKAKEAFGQGRYSEAAGHLAASALPVVGPAAANAGERIAAGDVAGGLGEGAALVAPIAAKYLATLDFQGRNVRYLNGARDYTMTEITRILGASIGRPHLKYVQFPDAVFRKGLLGAGLTPNAADFAIAINRGIDSGVVKAEARSASNTTQTTVEEFAKTTFAPAFNAAPMARMLT